MLTLVSCNKDAEIVYVKKTPFWTPAINMLDARLSRLKCLGKCNVLVTWVKVL